MVFPVGLTKFVNRYGKFLPEKFNTSQHARVEKVHLCKNVKSIILKRGTAHAQPMFCAQEAGRFCYFAGRILNGL